LAQALGLLPVSLAKQHTHSKFLVGYVLVVILPIRFFCLVIIGFLLIFYVIIGVLSDLILRGGSTSSL
jgi:hypothetical protein